MKPKTDMPKPNIQSYVIALCVLVLIIALIPLIETHKPYTETVMLHKQYLGDIADGCAGGWNQIILHW